MGRHTYVLAAPYSVSARRSGSLRLQRQHCKGESMAGAMRKMAVYLGLVEDSGAYGSYDEYDEYDEVARRSRDRYGDRTAPTYESRAVRTFRDEPPSQRSSTVTVNAPRRSAAPVHDVSRIHTIHPRSYNDARQIGEEFRAGVPVVMNLGELDDSDAKRIVDFAAGLIFGLHGTIERITAKVFLLSPANVDVATQARAQLAEDGFFNQS